MYNRGTFKLYQGTRKPIKGELGLNSSNYLFFHDGQYIGDYDKCCVLHPHIMGANDSILVGPEMFNTRHMFAIMNYKIKHDDTVSFIALPDGKPRLDRNGKATLVPTQPKKYDREEVLDLLELFGKALMRCKEDVEVDVDEWLDDLEGHKQKALEIGLRTNPAESDLEKPYYLSKEEV